MQLCLKLAVYSSCVGWTSLCFHYKHTAPESEWKWAETTSSFPPCLVPHTEILISVYIYPKLPLVWVWLLTACLFAPCDGLVSDPGYIHCLRPLCITVEVQSKIMNGCTDFFAHSIKTTRQVLLLKLHISDNANALLIQCCVKYFTT